MCGFEIIAKPDKNKRDHLLKQLISIVSCRFCRAEYDNEILLPYHTSAVDKRRFFYGGEGETRTLAPVTRPTPLGGLIFLIKKSIISTDSAFDSQPW